MKIHEFQAKQLLSRYGVPVPPGRAAGSAPEVYEAARRLPRPVVVKAQIHAGGRGKAGGIKIASTPEEAEAFGRQILGTRLVTPQTGPGGREVRILLVEKALEIRRELYVGVVIDRGREMLVVMASTEGGVEIEEVARRSPEKILKEWVDPLLGLCDYQARRICYGLGVDAGRGADLLKGLCRAFMELDCSLVEINPLVENSEGDLIASDAKLNFDDNALYRHPDVVELRDFNEEDPLEIQASRYGLSYIKLDGNVGCMVNGAGLAMATMDIIKLAGGDPANFLDVGGGASVEQVKQAFRILLSDSSVEAVLINIFGGIMRCDTVAEGVVQAARQVSVELPVVVRLEGTNVTEGRRILRTSGLQFVVADSMADAAERVVQAARGGK